VQRFLDTQAILLADAIVQNLPQARFQLPDRVVIEPGGQPKAVPADFREQMVGGLVDRLTRTDLRTALRTRLAELEDSDNKAIATAGSLIRYATAEQLIHNMLPSGRTVTYTTLDGEEIPTIPVSSDLEPESAITATTDAIAEEDQVEAGRGELLVPFVPYARRFYLPQWVAFDDQSSLLVSSVNQAEAYLQSMQRYVTVLHTAISLAPYVVADLVYQQKRYGILGQLINQGRALARYITTEIIRTIKRRAAANDLNRGLNLSLPYFDDQELELRNHNFEVIPAGRIMFVPAFVVLAAREEQVKVAQDTRLSASTRKHLLAELESLAQAFETSPSEKNRGKVKK
jgi:hypothetical protein